MQTPPASPLVPSSAAATATMRANRRANTKPEIVIRSLLHADGLRFRKDLAVQLPGRRVRPDVVFTRWRIAVFIDGCFWHACPEHGSSPKANAHYWGPKLARNAERDRLDTEALEAAGWRVLRVWEHVAPRRAASEIAAAVAAAQSEAGAESR